MYQPEWRRQGFTTTPNPMPVMPLVQLWAVNVVRDYETGNGVDEQVKRYRRLEFARWLYETGRINK